MIVIVVDISSLFHSDIFKLLITEKSYAIIRKIVHSVVEVMFEEGRKTRNLMLIQDVHSSTEIARAVKEHNSVQSIQSSCNLIHTILTEIQKMGIFLACFMILFYSDKLHFDRETVLCFCE